MDDMKNVGMFCDGNAEPISYTELTEQELWSLLYQKIENEMAGYMKRLDQLSRDELINHSSFFRLKSARYRLARSISRGGVFIVFFTKPLVRITLRPTTKK